MEVRATSKYIKGSPQKARLVADLIRGKSAQEALSILRFSRKRAARPIEKTLRSAIANAENRSSSLEIDSLVVSQAFVDSGPTKGRRRLRPAPMGRAYRQMRRSSHITVFVSDGRDEEE